MTIAHSTIHTVFSRRLGQGWSGSDFQPPSWGRLLLLLCDKQVPQQCSLKDCFTPDHLTLLSPLSPVNQEQENNIFMTYPLEGFR